MDWGAIIGAIITIAVAAITVAVVPWLREKLSAEQLAVVQRWVSIAVLAAEQIFGSGTGAKKKAYVLEWLTARGIKLDAEALDAMIEAAVKQLT